MAKKKQEHPTPEETTPELIGEEVLTEEVVVEEPEAALEPKEDEPTAPPKSGDDIIFHHDPEGKEEPWAGVLVSVDLKTGIATLSLKTPGGEATGANVPYGDDFGHWETAPRG